MTAGARTSRRPTDRAVAANARRRGYAVGGLAAVVLMLLVAHGCGQDAPWQDQSQFESDIGNPCGYDPITSDYGEDLYEHFLHWTPDGSHLVFDVDATIWTLNVESAELLQVADVNPDRSFNFGFYADVSPDGSRIVYSTCEYFDDGYEIVTVKMDGTGRRRLTQDGYFDHYPVWSPDGKQIAFVGHRLWADPNGYYEIAVDRYPVGSPRDQLTVKLSILSAKGGAGRLLDIMLRRGGVSRLEATSRLALSPPVWSPDGEYLAFIANEGERRRYTYQGRQAFRYTRVLHTIRSDGSKVVRLGETTAVPTWSPDNDELAYAAVDGEVSALYAVRPDGTRRRLIWSGRADGGFGPISQVSWSPDGTELLFLSNEPYVVSSGGGEPRRLGIARHVPDARASWSPDGSRIAIHYPYQQIVTVSRDGTELLVHAQADIKETPPRGLLEPAPPRPRFRALAPPLLIALPYRFDCSAAVPNPDANPGLLQDCETLLQIRTALFGLEPAGWDWREDRPIAEWKGVVVGGAPPRVRRLVLGRDVLRGVIPPEIGKLTMLEILGFSYNHLSGPIPPELGQLTNLESLALVDNLLSGHIPPELGALKNLTALHLGENSLTGAIPAELGALKNLTRLDLSTNSLTGAVPAELRGLTRLKRLNLYRSGLSGCIPAAWPKLWVDRSWLEYCKPKGEDGS